MIRLDRLVDAMAAGTVLTAGGASLEFVVGAESELKPA